MDDTKMESNSLATLCRICARHSDSVLDLFNAKHKGEKLVEMLSFCLKQLIHKDDGLPRIICEECGSNLIMVHEFHTLHSNSEQRFREILEISQKKVKVEIGFGPCGNEMKLENEGEMVLLPELSYFSNDLDTNRTCQSNLVKGLDNSELSLKTKIKDERRQKSKKLETKKLTKNSKSHRRDPENSSLNVEFYECFQCRKYFEKFRDLQRHTISHIGIEKPYECSGCQIRFVYLKSLIRHRRQKHPSRIYECEYCTEAFVTLTVLKQHLENLHKQEMKTYKCALCSKQYIVRLQFSCHQLEHLNSQQISCKVCGASFPQHRMLKNHIRDKHTNHLCSECGKTFKTIHLLASHQNLHKSDTPFACDQCPNRFKWKAALTTHMLIHSGQKKHVCDTCGSSFTTKGSLNKHNLIHTGTRPFPCETCSMRFYSKDHLKRHIRTHSGEKPYKCKYCDRAFSQSNDLTKHTRSHVGQNMYKCPDCPEAFRLQTELRNHSFQHYQAAKGT